MGLKLSELPKEAVRYLKNAWRLIIRPAEGMELHELVRRRTYGMYSILLILIIFVCFLLFIFLHIPELLVFAAVMLAVYLGYILSTENRFATGKVIEHIAKCSARKVIRGKNENALCTFQFDGIGDSEGTTIFINKTEKLGYLENATYYLVFSDDGTGTCRGENLIGSIQLQ